LISVVASLAFFRTTARVNDAWSRLLLRLDVEGLLLAHHGVDQEPLVSALANPPLFDVLKTGRGKNCPHCLEIIDETVAMIVKYPVHAHDRRVPYIRLIVRSVRHGPTLQVAAGVEFAIWNDDPHSPAIHQNPVKLTRQLHKGGEGDMLDAVFGKDSAYGIADQRQAFSNVPAEVQAGTPSIVNVVEARMKIRAAPYINVRARFRLALE